MVRQTCSRPAVNRMHHPCNKPADVRSVWTAVLARVAALRAERRFRERLSGGGRDRRRRRPTLGDNWSDGEGQHDWTALPDTGPGAEALHVAGGQRADTWDQPQSGCVRPEVLWLPVPTHSALWLPVPTHSAPQSTQTAWH